ncbi:MAG: phosphoethanolamine transferase [Acidobacteria bacterium]|nr:phosphoethanolamine transferase [Acidobacteriota bacterium]
MMQVPKIKTNHITFSLVFTFLLFTINNLVNIGKLAKWFMADGSVNLVPFGSFLIIGLSLFNVIFFLVAHKYTTKALAMILVFLSGLATYFIAKYNVAIDRSMLMNVLNTDYTESTALLSVHMFPYILFLILLPILLITRIEINYQKPTTHLFNSAKAIVLSLILAVSLAYLNFNAISQAVNISDKYTVHTLVPINVIRSSLSVVWYGIAPKFKTKMKDIDFSAQVTEQKDLIVVLAVGETTRQKNVSLYGYDRKNTTPLLAQVANLQVLNGIASEGSTLYALPKILKKNGINLTAVTAKAGIESSCFVNFTLYGNCDPVQEVKVSQCGHEGNCYDEDVIPLLESNLSTYSSGSRFIVLHLGGGSHGPRYRDRYPPEFNVFQPICMDADVINQCSEEELYNSYDNSVLYLDYVLNSVLNKLEQSKLPYVMIYLSDHGESLGEEGRVFHGMPPGIALPPEQAEIPLLVKSSLPIQIEARAQYTQSDVFDSVLHLFSIESPHFQENHGFIQLAPQVKNLAQEGEADTPPTGAETAQ